MSHQCDNILQEDLEEIVNFVNDRILLPQYIIWEKESVKHHISKNLYT